MSGVLPGSRWISTVAVALGVLLFVQRLLVSGDSLYGAPWRALVIAGGLMALLGVTQRFWRGAEIEEATMPGGPGVRFVHRTASAVAALEARVDEQMRGLTERVIVLERELERKDVGGAA